MATTRRSARTNDKKNKRGGRGEASPPPPRNTTRRTTRNTTASSSAAVAAARDPAHPAPAAAAGETPRQEAPGPTTTCSTDTEIALLRTLVELVADISNKLDAVVPALLSIASELGAQGRDTGDAVAAARAAAADVAASAGNDAAAAGNAAPAKAAAKMSRQYAQKAAPVSDAVPRGLVIPEQAQTSKTSIAVAQSTPAGLVNTGASCYCNSVMQALYGLGLFRNRLLAWGGGVDGTALAVQSTFRKMQGKESEIKTNEIVTSLDFDDESQQDAHEFKMRLPQLWQLAPAGGSPG
jgi:hypothetical protein